MKKLIIVSLVSIIVFTAVYSQEAKIELTKKGYGDNPRQVYLTIHNTGNKAVSEISILVDGQEFRIIKAKLTPTRGFEFSLFLDPGTHLIEAKTLEGGYSSLEVVVSSVDPSENAPIKDKPKSLEDNMIKIALISLLIIVIFIWLLSRKPKLEL
jgi:hypothetical protein